MVGKGAIRIGTLHDFQRLEHGVERGDAHEGEKVTRTDGQEAVMRGDKLPGFMRRALPRIPNPERVTFHFSQGYVFELQSKTPDLYVYCTCSRFEPDLLKLFGGACVSINEPNSFFAAVTGALSGWDECGVSRVTTFQLAACEYRDRAETWPHISGYNPVFRKPPYYEHQSEVRAVWWTPRRDIRPVNLTVPEIRQYCQRLA